MSSSSLAKQMTLVASQPASAKYTKPVSPPRKAAETGIKNRVV